MHLEIAILTRDELYERMGELKHLADYEDVSDVTEKLAVYKVPINRKPGVPPLNTLKTLLPSLEEAKLLAMDEAALLAALGISTVEKVPKTCYIGPPIIEETNATANATAAADAEVRFVITSELSLTPSPDPGGVIPEAETSWRRLAGL